MKNEKLKKIAIVFATIGVLVFGSGHAGPGLLAAVDAVEDVTYIYRKQRKNKQQAKQRYRKTNKTVSMWPRRR